VEIVLLEELGLILSRGSFKPGSEQSSLDTNQPSSKFLSLAESKSQSEMGVDIVPGSVETILLADCMYVFRVQCSRDFSTIEFVEC